MSGMKWMANGGWWLGVSRPTAHALRSTPYAGMSLLEVLAAIGVLSIGLLGLAALLPAGRYTIGEATKADRAGQCGRAALHDVVARRMLDYHNWYDPTQNKFVYDPSFATYGQGNRPWYDQFGRPTQWLPASFIIDPEGAAYAVAAGEANPSFGNGGASVPRISVTLPVSSAGGTIPIPFTQNQLALPCTQPMADLTFKATDDLVVPMPEELTPPQPVGRPQNLVFSTSANTSLPYPLDYAGQYSWFLTVSPQANSSNRFMVSVVVCFNRNLPQPPPVQTPIGERAVTVQFNSNTPCFFDMAAVNGPMVAIGGGSVQLTREINDIAADETASPPTTAGITIKENDWVALCNTQPPGYNSPSNPVANENPGTTPGLCRWYRVGSIGDNSSYLTLVGPDWTPAFNAKQVTQYKDLLVALGQSVVGVYTTTIDVDTDPTWKY